MRVARDGLIRVMQSPDPAMANWARLGRHYRRLLYERGQKEPDRNRGGIAAERVASVLAAGGRLTTHEVLRCRVRYFSDGMILGSRIFVDEMFVRHHGNFGVQRQTGARPMRSAQWKGLFTARRLQLAPITPPAVC